MKAASRWYFASLLLFWGSTVVVTIVDLAGVEWFGMTWSTGPDLFPNRATGIPLALAQFVAAVLLLVAAWKMAAAAQTNWSAALYVFLAASTAAASFLAFSLFALWYHTEVMRRPL